VTSSYSLIIIIFTNHILYSLAVVVDKKTSYTTWYCNSCLLYGNRTIANTDWWS